MLLSVIEWNPRQCHCREEDPVLSPQPSNHPSIYFSWNSEPHQRICLPLYFHLSLSFLFTITIENDPSVSRHLVCLPLHLSHSHPSRTFIDRYESCSLPSPLSSPAHKTHLYFFICIHLPQLFRCFWSLRISLCLIIWWFPVGIKPTAPLVIPLYRPRSRKQFRHYCRTLSSVCF